MITTLNYIDADQGVAGSVTIETKLFFPARKRKLEELESVLRMSRSDEELRKFLHDLRDGVRVAHRVNRMKHGVIISHLENGHIGEKAAAKEMQRIEKEERMLISNEEVIEQWQVELQTSSN